jgi:hypothetical protein
MALAAFLLAAQGTGTGTTQTGNTPFTGYVAISIVAAVVALIVLVIIRSGGRGVPKA